MLRALAKAAVLSGFGRLPGGARLYRELTRNWMGTQATHVDKLRRVWPGYVDVWRTRCSLEFDGLDVWVHEGGWTPFPALVSYLLTGKGGTITNSEGRVLDRYLARAVNGALSSELPSELVSAERRSRLEPLRWSDHACDALKEVGAKEIIVQRSAAIPLPATSHDLCHSGGALEHYCPEVLRSFLHECYRVLRPGGIASHVFDHRDHLYHADKGLPFMAHLALPGRVYQLLCGHALGYHNRLLPTQVATMFEEVGFEPVAVRRMILPDRRYVEGEEALAGRPGLQRSRLALQFRTTSDVDLRTAAAHYLVRKPLG